MDLNNVDVAAVLAMLSIHLKMCLCISMLDIFSRLQDHMMTQVCLRPVSTCRMAAITSAVLSAPAPAPAPASPVTLLEAR